MFFFYSYLLFYYKNNELNVKINNFIEYTSVKILLINKQFSNKNLIIINVQKLEIILEIN
jgi:hypothetical protein